MSVKPFPQSVAGQFLGRGRPVWTTGHWSRKRKSQIMTEKQEANLELLLSSVATPPRTLCKSLSLFAQSPLKNED